MNKKFSVLLALTLIAVGSLGFAQAQPTKYNLATVVNKTVMGFLEGTWVVECPSGHRDYVGGITRNHQCETCGKKAVTDGGAIVVCPRGHTSGVGGVTAHHKCPSFNCGEECRRD